MTEPELTALVRDVVAYVATRPDVIHDVDDAEGLTMRLDRLMAAVAAVDIAFDDADYPEPPDDANGYPAAVARMNERFPYMGYYNAVTRVTEDVGSDSASVGDAIDDIADIVGDLSDYLWRVEHTSAADAVWHLDQTYRYHWGLHARWLQLYLMNLRMGR